MAKVIITIGDPAGVGPEVIEAALQDPRLPKDVDYEIIGSSSACRAGHPTAASARIAFDALLQAAEALKQGDADAVVTAPICKEALQQLGFDFPGQTEFFADSFGIEDFGMLLTGDQLTVGLATIHEPLKNISTLLNDEKIERICRLTLQFLNKRGLLSPKIAVAGLNPHAGEHGAFGREEIEIISPTIQRLESIFPQTFFGPAVPDAVFRDAMLKHYDAVIAMYHDQGLIPLKMIDFDNAVNVTLGLPKPRTSPDHGTAFSIAGKGIANPNSMLRAIQLAAELI